MRDLAGAKLVRRRCNKALRRAREWRARCLRGASPSTLKQSLPRGICTSRRSCSCRDSAANRLAAESPEAQVIASLREEHREDH